MKKYIISLVISVNCGGVLQEQILILKRNHLGIVLGVDTSIHPYTKTLLFYLIFNYLSLDFLLPADVPAYMPNQAAPLPTTIEISPDCSKEGSGKSINHIVQ
jgi:hypothetical protein